MASFWDKIRKDFPVTRRSLYLDHAAGGPVPHPVRQRVREYLDENALEADFAWPKWMKRVEKIRENAARFINARPEEITFIQSTSQGMNYIADLLEGGDRVLTNSLEFPSTTLPWLWRGRELVFQEPEQGRISMGKLESLLSPSVSVILSSYVQYGTGFRQDMRRLGRIKKDRCLVVNATQGFGVLPVDVQSWKADFLCANSYKWLMAGYGGGILYIRKKWLKKLRPKTVGWRSMKGADRMNNRNLNLLPTASRYELGCPSFGTIFSVGAAIEYLDGIGMDRIEERVLSLTGYAAERLRERGFEIASPMNAGERSGILVIRLKQAKSIWKRLMAKNVFVTARGEGIRLGPHFYNTPEEIDRFIRLLQQCRDAESGSHKRGKA